MIKSYFSSEHLFVFALIAILYVISIYFYSFKKNILYALLFLLAGAFVTRILVISFDDYLHLWDEQYHALVAKNLSVNPFIPVLFKNPVLAYNPNIWTENHVWLHKQPVFLWQMALSIKLLGPTAFAVRLPSAIMSLLLVLIIFRLGKIIVGEKIGFIAAFLFSACYYMLDFIGGVYNTDHNDIAFIFYVTLSIWAYTEYFINKNKKYIWLIGLFAGLAVLNKWLVGLLVFSGWGVAILFMPGITNKIAEAKNFTKALFVCLLTFIPWQVYILSAFPYESRQEYIYNSQHFLETIEGHTGSYLYHFEQAIEQYGMIAACLLPFALIVLFRDIKNVFVRVGYVSFIVIVYTFFSIAATKMPAFCLIVSPVLFLALGNLLNRMFEYVYRIKTNMFLLNWVSFLLLLAIGIINFDVGKLQAQHTDQVKNDIRAYVRNIKRKTMDLVELSKGKYDAEKTIVFNCSEHENIPFMFFTGYTAYDKIPSFEEYSVLKNAGYKIVFVNNYSPIPDYLKNDKEVSFISSAKESIVFLKIKNDKYLCVDKALNDIVVANRINSSTWETFTLIVYKNNECAISSFENKFLCADLHNHTEITATRNALGPWETFTLIPLDGNRVALKAFNGKYLSIDEQSLRVFANADAVGDWEVFEIIKGR